MEKPGELDDLLAMAASGAAERGAAAAGISGDFMARLMADAVGLQPKQVVELPQRAAPPAQIGWFRALSDLFGGGGAMATMASAALAGLYLGVVQPAPVLALTSALMGETVLDQMDLIPGTDALWAQE